MQVMTDDSQKLVAEIASRHGFSSEAAGQVAAALAAGGGRQAQFNHPELGGMGQWSQGGMTMIGDMFNTDLKSRVAALCNDLAGALANTRAPAPEEPQPWNPASDSSSARLFMLAAFGHRWPADLGAPAATGSQNDLNYAIFPSSRRLAIEQNGHVTVYDTGDHRIGGVSQQQGDEQTLRFTSQTGVVRLADLKIVGDEPYAEEPAQPAIDTAKVDRPAAVAHRPAATGGNSDDEIFSRLERLADLRSRDIITAEEFATKKAELLARL